MHMADRPPPADEVIIFLRPVTGADESDPDTAEDGEPDEEDVE